MKTVDRTFTRRRFLHRAGVFGAGLVLGGAVRGSNTFSADFIRRTIPSSGETIPAIGMGTYITFNVGPSSRLRAERARVLQTFFDGGGGMIDSSPMYGTSEEVIGDCLRRVSGRQKMFSATKVWTSSDAEGPRQIRESEKLWGVSEFDLLQVHNLVNWRTHLNLLRTLKEEGRVRYTGVTTSHGRRHREIESILRNEPVDFVQLTYNILNRETEESLIPLARERGIAVIANRPYAGGWLMDRYQREKLPPWRGEVGVENWADFFLKYIISLPGVTCAIPATSRVLHMRENMNTMRGPLPDQAGRTRMAEYVARL